MTNHIKTLINFNTKIMFYSWTHQNQKLSVVVATCYGRNSWRRRKRQMHIIQANKSVLYIFSKQGPAWSRLLLKAFSKGWLSHSAHILASCFYQKSENGSSKEKRKRVDEEKNGTNNLVNQVPWLYPNINSLSESPVCLSIRIQIDVNFSSFSFHMEKLNTIVSKRA